MPTLREETRAGLDGVDVVTALLQRVRNAHPTAGSFQAAEVQFWWTAARPTDTLGQLFWFDEDGRPEAGVILTDWTEPLSLVYGAPTLVAVTMPDSSPEWVTHVLQRGLAHADASGIEAIELEVDRVDDVTRAVLFERGFTVQDDGVIECWLDTKTRPVISPLPEGYRLASRSELMDRPHHMTGPRRPDFEQRIGQLSLYRSDLDLVVLDSDDNPAAYALFWNDPVTGTGVVEPVRTLDEHQGRGLSRHVLTTGIDLLAQAGARRISIGFEPGNPASSHLYQSLGFEPHRQTDLFAGSTSTPTE